MKKTHLMIGVVSLVLMGNAVSGSYCDSVAKWSGEVGKANDEGRSIEYCIEVTRDWFSIANLNGQYPGMKIEDAYLIVDLVYKHDMNELTARNMIKDMCVHAVSKGLRLTSKAQ